MVGGGVVPLRHGDHLQLDRERVFANEPAGHFTERQAVAHRHHTRTDETLLSLAQRQTFDGSARRVRPIEHPHRLAKPCSSLEHIQQGRDEGIDPATEVLQIDEDHIAVCEHLVGRSAHASVQAVYGYAVARIEEIRRFDHVVLLIAAQTVLRTQRRGHSQMRHLRERIEAVLALCGHRGGVCK